MNSFLSRLRGRIILHVYIDYFLIEVDHVYFRKLLANPLFMIPADTKFYQY
jgi:hypothetical protein